MPRPKRGRFDFRRGPADGRRSTRAHSPTPLHDDDSTAWFDSVGWRSLCLHSRRSRLSPKAPAAWSAACSKRPAGRSHLRRAGRRGGGDGRASRSRPAVDGRYTLLNVPAGPTALGPCAGDRLRPEDGIRHRGAAGRRGLAEHHADGPDAAGGRNLRPSAVLERGSVNRALDEQRTAMGW